LVAINFFKSKKAWKPGFIPPLIFFEPFFVLAEPFFDLAEPFFDLAEPFFLAPPSNSIGSSFSFFNLTPHPSLDPPFCSEFGSYTVLMLESLVGESDSEEDTTTLLVLDFDFLLFLFQV